MITLTERAADKLKDMLEREKECSYIRVNLRGSGCHGYAYSLGLDDFKTSHDVEFVHHDVKVLADEISIPMIEGLIIDFDTSDEGNGFMIHNPNESSSCSHGDHATSSCGH